MIYQTPAFFLSVMGIICVVCVLCINSIILYLYSLNSCIDCRFLFFSFGVRGIFACHGWHEEYPLTPFSGLVRDAVVQWARRELLVVLSLSCEWYH